MAGNEVSRHLVFGGAQMGMRTYSVQIEGLMPLIMHQDNVDWSGLLKKWQSDPKNKGISQAGDDRSPAWTWIGSLYHDGKTVGIPSDNLMTMMRGGAAMVPTGKRGATFKAQSQSGMLVFEAFWPLVVPKGGKPGTIPVDFLEGLKSELDFEAHQTAVKAAGFELFVKRAKIGQSKHIRVRPIFAAWAAAGTLKVWDDQITTDVVASILELGGRYKGLGDWRPGCKTPGPFGTFKAEVKEIKE
jgi:hypothetical protein